MRRRGNGYPVALKVQSAQLLHQTEVGGVAVGLFDEAALRSAWAAMTQRIAAARPDAEIVEIDVNPLIVFGEGKPPVALDALDALVILD